MGWSFRKTITTGPVRHTLTHKGIGSSVRILGARIGISIKGDPYFSLSIPKTGIYYIKFFTGKKSKTTHTSSSRKSSRKSDQKQNAQNDSNGEIVIGSDSMSHLRYPDLIE